jgi:hypothetical protein
MDEDLDSMTREQLISEARRLRAGVRTHRDSTGHELCWHHPALWSLLPEKTDPLPTVPTWPEFLRGCIRYRESLDEQLPAARRSDAAFGRWSQRLVQPMNDPAAAVAGLLESRQVAAAEGDGNSLFLVTAPL